MKTKSTIQRTAQDSFRFVVSVPLSMADQIETAWRHGDKAIKDRNAWVVIAIAEKLARDAGKT